MGDLTKDWPLHTCSKTNFCVFFLTLEEFCPPESQFEFSQRLRLITHKILLIEKDLHLE